MQQVLITGASGSIGQMLQAGAASCPVPAHAISLRSPSAKAAPEADCTMLLHLANIHGDVQENNRLQQRVADLAAQSGIRQVIIPLSFSTLGILHGNAPDADALNFGFRVSMNDPYPAGKLAVEEFWSNWQRAQSDRQLLLLYVPTILGSHSKWTREVALFSPQQTIFVPQIERFFTIKEEQLVELLHDCFERGWEQNIERRLAIGESGSLLAAIAADRGGNVTSWQPSAAALRRCASAEQSGLVNKALAVGGKLRRKLRQLAGNTNYLPVSPKYLSLFYRQSAWAERIEGGA